MVIRKVGVAGAGLMGSGIAQACAQNGYNTLNYDVLPEQLDKAKDSVKSNLLRLVNKGKFTGEFMSNVLSRMDYTCDLNTLAECDLIIECICENMEAKQELFRQLDSFLPQPVIILSNTSTLSISRIASATKRENRVMGMHFFSPAPVMKLVELVRGKYTDDETYDIVHSFALSLRKVTVNAQDRPGFIVNRLNLMIKRIGMELMTLGVEAGQIDTTVRVCRGLPMGPLELTDFTGLDVSCSGLKSLHEELGDSYRVPAILSRYVENGYLGRKTGRGFYSYAEAGDRVKNTPAENKSMQDGNSNNSNDSSISDNNGNISNKANVSTGALSNVTILDLTRVLCGPFATMLLGDMGANIIKIEHPKDGDDTRTWGPFKNGASAYFAAINRNKKSITLNLKAKEGREMLLKMARKADVVVENFRPGVMERLGLSYDVLSRENEKIIYASASGFGSWGPYSDRPGYDIIAQAMGGIMSLTGHPGGPPTRVGSSIADITSGMNLVIGILAALHARTITGKGQQFEVALVDSIVSCTTVENMRYHITGEVPERIGNRYAMLCPYGAFRASDGEFILGCGNQKLFELFCSKVLNQPELIKDDRFKDVVSRSAHYPQIKEYVEKWSLGLTANQAVNTLIGVGIPAAPILDAGQIASDEHIAVAREMFVQINQPVIGELTVTASPVKFAGTSSSIRMPAPLLGQHNAEVYGEMLGIDREQLQGLKQEGII